MTRSPVEHEVQEALKRLLVPPFRAGALLLTRPAADGGTNICAVVAMREANLETAVDVSMLVRRLRGLADELEQTLQGKRALPGRGPSTEGSA